MLRILYHNNSEEALNLLKTHFPISLPFVPSKADLLLWEDSQDVLNPKWPFNPPDTLVFRDFKLFFAERFFSAPADSGAHLVQPCRCTGEHTESQDSCDCRVHQIL